MRRRIRQAIAEFKHVKLGLPRLEVKPSDCFVTSWPRSGNTWMRYLVFYSLYPDSRWDLVSIEERMPIIDRDDLKKVLPTMDEPRMFKSHDPFAPYMLGGRVAYILRDGRDAMVSLYNYRTQMAHIDEPFGEFLRKTLEGRYAYGPWHEHVAGWLDHGGDPAVLIVRYEDMLKDPGAQAKRVLQHFGLDASDQRVARSVERSNIDQVNKGFQRYAANKGRKMTGGLGGGKGRWREMYSDADLELFMRYSGEAMRRAGYGE